jgi:hypothetical protein
MTSQKNMHPNGMPARAGCSTSGRESLLTSLQDVGPFFSTISGGIACAQPPAKGFDANGIGTVT